MRKATTTELAAIHNLSLPAYDLLLMADGSGSRTGQPYGWHLTAHASRTGRIWEFWGGASAGSSNIAELEPFLHALRYFHSLIASRPLTKPVRVLALSDSEVTVKCGSKVYGRSANLPLWSLLDWFVENGFAIEWRHVPRNSTLFHARADSEARKVRLALLELSAEASEEVEQVEQKTSSEDESCQRSQKLPRSRNAPTSGTTSRPSNS